jgi:protein TonB
MRKLSFIAITLTVQAAGAAAQSTDPRPANSPAKWLSISDYPPEALAKHQSGTVGFALAIDASGHVQSCLISQSSGASSLDDATCALLKSRALFEPARDAAGHSIQGRFASHVQWVYPQTVAASEPQQPPIELHGSERNGNGMSVLSVDETGHVLNCVRGDDPYWNVSAAADFCGLFPVGSRYGPPTLFKGKPVKRRITLTLQVRDENVP